MKNTYSKIKGKVAKKHKSGEIKTTGDLLADALATIEYAKDTIPDPIDGGLADHLDGMATDILHAVDDFRSALLSRDRI